MNEAADAASTLPAILLLWLWWTFLSALDIFTSAREAQDKPGQAVSPPAEEVPQNRDDRFIGICRLDPSFRVDAFLDGARKAYEIVVLAYAAADLDTLRPLLSHEVLTAFAGACADRAERGESLELTFIGIENVEVETVEVTAGAMEVTLRFRAQALCAERSADGTVIGGSPSHVAELEESWTFARAVPVTGSAWTVVATGG